MTTGAFGDGPGLLTILNSQGLPRRVISVPESNGGAAVERHPLVRGWAVATYFDDSGGESGLSRLLLFDDELTRLPVEQDLGRTHWRSTSIVDTKRRLSIVQATDAGIVHRAFAGTELREDLDARSITDPGTYLEDGAREGDRERIVSAVSAARLRDTVIVTFMDHSELSTYVVDPFGDEPPTDPVPVAQSPAYVNPGIAGDDMTGTAGICFPNGEGPLGGGAPDADEIRFAAVGPDGRPVGEPVTIISDLR